MLKNCCGEPLNPQEFANVARGLLAAAAMIDPPWAVCLYEELADDVPSHAKNHARRGIVAILSARGEARWQAASDFLQMWMPWHRIQ